MKLIQALFRTLFLLFVAGSVSAQVIPTSAYERLEAYSKRQEARDTSWFRDIPMENIGPTIFSCRVTDIAVNPDNPWEFVVAYASGGLWHTINNGVSFTPYFQQEAVMTIGAIAVDWRRRVVWIGTGEVNSSRSSYAGVGIYKGKLGSDHWSLVGLEESHHIGRILLNPNDSNRIAVAVMGPLYSKSSNRGVFQSSDGGRSWKKTLYVNDSTGCIDLVADPVNPQTLYASTWQRDRKAWNFIESGPGSAIYKTTNGGKLWDRMTVDTSGFPTGPGVGRIGLAAIHPDSQTVLYALLDNYYPAEENATESTAELEPSAFLKMDEKEFLDLDDEKLNQYLRSRNFPKKYTAASVKKMVKSHEVSIGSLSDYVEDANYRLLTGKVKGAELYRSTDNGISWSKTHDMPLDHVYNTYGYYFGLLSVVNGAPERIYIGGVPLLRSNDGGSTFSMVNHENVHADHHALWINPKRPEHMILGNDGGINISYDGGDHWIKCNSPAVGQYYAIQADDQDPFWVYGGTQDNGVWKGSHQYRPGTQWHQTGNYHYKSIMGGDGMQVEVDTRDHRYVYTGFQFGNYYRLDDRTGKRTYITPKHELGEHPYRWNWQTPIHLSRHNQDILYMGSNFVHRSMDQGNTFNVLSPDLTTGGIQGDVPYGTLTCLHESPLKFGLLYTGSDDGLAYVSKDGGDVWTCISDGFPAGLYVSRIQASGHQKSRVYISLNGYRNDHFRSYVYVSDDYGSTWQRIGLDLPQEPVNVIKEDPKHPEILYVGTDHSVYCSLDGGKSFMSLSAGLPDVAVHDLIPHHRDDKLILGTHGRSLYVLDISRLRQFEFRFLDKELTWYPLDTIKYRETQGKVRASYMPANVDTIYLEAFCGMDGIVTCQVITHDGATLFGNVLDMKKGYNRWAYDFQVTERGVSNWQQLNPKTPIADAPFYKGEDGRWYLKAGTFDLLLRHETGWRVEQKLILKK